MTDLGPISFFLGIAASCTKKGMFLSQYAFARDILSHPYMLSFNPCSIPTDTNPKLSPRRTPITDPTLYRSLAGALQYLNFTCPHIAYVVQQMSFYA